MKLKTHSFWKAHSPIALLFSALVVVVFCECARTPTPDITGPSGSDMLCLGFWILNAILWLPLGIFLLFIQRNDSFYSVFDKYLRNVFCALAILFFLWAFFLLVDKDGGITKKDYHIVVIATVIPNYLVAKLIHLFTGKNTIQRGR